jgi:RNA polymerase sigma-70 factor (ECF subfamily)
MLEAHLGILLKIARAYTHTFQDREDLISDIVYEMWKSFPDFKGHSKVSTWIYRVALNTALNQNRRNRKKRDFLQHAIDISTNESAEENSVNPQVELLYECIDELDEFSKAIILLYLDGHKHEEIAEITGISTSNVGTRVSRIKEVLKNRIITKQEHHGIK